MGLDDIIIVAADEAQRLVLGARIERAMIKDAMARRIGDDAQFGLRSGAIAIDERIALLRDRQLLGAEAARENGFGRGGKHHREQQAHG